MPKENENKEGTLRKECPFLQQGKWCIGEVCALWVEFGQTLGGMQRKVGMCVFVGTSIVLSEMNMRLQQQGRQVLPQLQIPPGMGRG